MSRVDDIITREVLRLELQSIADETAIRFTRSSFSPVIRDYLDFSTALCDARGRMVVQGFSLPLHLGAIPRAMEAVRERFDEGLQPGDLVILNDPYAGGMHLPDVFMIAPAHQDGEIVGYAVVVAHQADIGGRVPGGSAADSREIFEEGLRIPPLLLRQAGQPVPGIETVIRANVRLPDLLWADLAAQRAGCEGGATALADLVRRHGRTRLDEAVEAVLEQGRQGARQEISQWPDGTYSFSDLEDHDGIQPLPVPIVVQVEIDGGRVRFDFTGTAAQVRGSINATLSFTESACYAAVRALCRDDVPVNAGFCETIEVHAPAGTVVNATFPAGVAARGVIGYRIIETVFGALSGALGDRVPACGEGGTSGIRLGGFTKGGIRFQMNDIVCGAWGARPNADGLDGASPMAANVSNRPVELVERDDPVTVLAYGFVPDSGGPGTYRGGLAIRRVLRLDADEAVLNLRTHRTETPPYGLEGGLPGSTAATWLVRDGERSLLAAKTTEVLCGGDVIEHWTASGGGHGDPHDRDPDAVRTDVLDGKVAAESARDLYGVDVTDEPPQRDTVRPGANRS